MRKKVSSFMNSKYMLATLSILCAIFIIISFFTDALTAPLRNMAAAVVMPIQKGMNYMGLWVYDSANSFQDMQQLIAENEALKDNIDSLTEENNRLKQDSYELDRLRKLYELDAKYPGYEKVAARIIGNSTENWFSTFTIDKGSDDGIEVDMNVIAGDGLVGIVTQVGKNYSIVTSIIEDGSYVSGMLIDSAEICAVEGDIELMDTGLIQVKYFKSNANVKNGDKIVTSNISEKYLPGILVGYAKDVSLDANNLTKSGYLLPAVDFAHLQEVLIIKEKKNNGED